jgi:hypothetical protein
MASTPVPPGCLIRPEFPVYTDVREARIKTSRGDLP